MEINPANLQKEIKAFKKGIKRCNELNHVLEAIPAAVDLAYIDAKRTMTGIGEHEKQKLCAFNAIQIKLRKFFSGQAPVDQEKFDEKHKELCEIWCNCFRGSDIGTFGKAQKIVNMSFKYLYCCDDALTNYIEHFKFCHMPLDSFTLEWFKRDVNIREWFKNEERDKTKPRIISEKMASWSALEYDEEEDLLKDAVGYYLKDGKKEFYSYRFYLENIRKHIEKNKYQKDSGDVLSPLELEFIVWPESQKHLAAEGFLIGLKGISKKEDKKEIRDKSLEAKYKDIIEFLIDNGYKEDILKFLTEKGYIIVAPDEIKEKAAEAEQ